MNLNSMIYPAPKTSYTLKKVRDLIFVPNKMEQESIQQEQQQSTWLSPGLNSTCATSSISQDKATYDIPCIYIKAPVVQSEEEKEYMGHGIGYQYLESQSQVIDQFQSFAGSENKVMIYFHGNAEDLGLVRDFLDELSQTFKCAIFAMEYPGYGFFSHEIVNGKVNKQKQLSCSAEGISTNAKAVLNYILAPAKHGGLGYNQNDLIIYGRSMGSGPATLLSGMCTPYALILMSAYTTIKAVAQNMVGNMLGYLVANHFNNLERIEKVRCPTFLIHGKSDPLIPYKHSDQLFKKLMSSNQQILPTGTYKEFSKTMFHVHMTHNDFDLYDDILQPMVDFLQKITNKYYMQLQQQPSEGILKVQSQQNDDQIEYNPQPPNEQY